MLRNIGGSVCHSCLTITRQILLAALKSRISSDYSPKFRNSSDTFWYSRIFSDDNRGKWPRGNRGTNWSTSTRGVVPSIFATYSPTRASNISMRGFTMIAGPSLKNVSAEKSKVKRNNFPYVINWTRNFFATCLIYRYLFVLSIKVFWSRRTPSIIAFKGAPNLIRRQIWD